VVNHAFFTVFFAIPVNQMDLLTRVQGGPTEMSLSGKDNSLPCYNLEDLFFEDLVFEFILDFLFMAGQVV
jgi:hypothetical protein